MVQCFDQLYDVMLVCFVSVSCCLFSLFFVFLEVRYGLPLGAPWFSKAQGRAKRDVARMFERIGRGLARGGLVRGGLARGGLARGGLARSGLARGGLARGGLARGGLVTGVVGEGSVG